MRKTTLHFVFDLKSDITQTVLKTEQTRTIINDMLSCDMYMKVGHKANNLLLVISYYCRLEIVCVSYS